MKILITGSSGFIGSHLKEYLWEQDKDYELVLCDKKHGSQYDILKLEHWPKVDAVIHLAAQTDVQSSIADPLNDAEDNILAIIRLALAYPDTKIIYAGSAASLSINSPYGLSKKTGAEYIKLLCKDYVICNFPNVFGEGGAGVVSKFLEANTVQINGDGLQTRDLVYVNDICMALEKALKWEVGEYFLGSNKGYTILELAEATGKRIVFNPALEGEVRHSKIINSTPDWTATEDVIEYIKKNK